MLRLIAPAEAHPFVLSIDDPANPTIWHARPMTEAENAKLRAILFNRSISEDDRDVQLRHRLYAQITKVENVAWAGVIPYATDDPAIIVDIIKALPQSVGERFHKELQEFVTLSGKHAKNSDGSSALLVGGPVPAIQATPSTDASGAVEPNSQSQGSPDSQ